MRQIISAAIATLALCAAASAQSALFDFQDNTDQGFGAGFGDDASETFPIVNIGGSLRMEVLRNGGFQEAGRQTGNPADPQYLTMLAASSAEADWVLAYDWYLDTSLITAGPGSFLQLGTYVNTGNGYYAQDFPSTGKDVEIDGTQLTSGMVFSGTVSETFAAKGFNLPDAQTFFRFGLIVNGDGAAQKVYFDNIRIFAIPEPMSLSLLAIAPLALRRRR